MLTKENIKLRAPEPDDIEFIFSLENDTGLWNVSNTHNPFSMFDIEQYVLSAEKDIYQAKQLRLVIELMDENPKKVGIVDVFDFDAHNRRCGIGITILENYRKSGYAKLTLEIIINYLFNHLNIHQLFCNIDFDNFASINLFTKTGFKLSGVKKDWNIREGKWIDVNFYQLINSK